MLLSTWPVPPSLVVSSAAEPNSIGDCTDEDAKKYSAGWLLGTVVCATGFAGDDRCQRHRANSLEGVWNDTVTRLVPTPDCSGRIPIPDSAGGTHNPFPTLNAFHRGGTMGEHGSRLPPARRGSGVGLWKRSGRDRIEYLLLFQVFDANGFLALTQEARATMSLFDDEQTLAGTSSVTISPIGAQRSAARDARCCRARGIRLDRRPSVTVRCRELFALVHRFTEFHGGNSEWEPPDPISNSEVKTLCADDSVAVAMRK